MKYPIKMLVYGDPGIGKTVLCGTAYKMPELTPALLINYESGLMCIESKIEQIGVIDSWTIDDVLIPAAEGKIKCVKVTTMTQLSDIIDALYDRPNPYKCVMIDSLSEMNYTNLGEAVANNTKNMTGIPQISDYGASATQMRKIVRYFRDLPMHVIFTALAATIKDEFSGKVSIGPSLTGKLAFEVPALLDIVGYLHMAKIDGELKRVMRFQPDGTVTAKDRSEGGKLGEYMVDPTLPKIFDLLNVDIKETVSQSN